MPRLATIVLVVLPFVVSPGASFALTLGTVPAVGRRAVAAVVTGTAAGVATMVAVLVVTRLGEAVAASATATRTVGTAGGVVLVGLGAHMVIAALRGDDADSDSRPPASRLVAQAYLALLLNPKALSVYLVVVPSLAVGSSPPLRLYVVFAAVHVGLLAVWLLGVAWLLLHVPSVAGSVRGRRALGVVGGACLVGVGVVTAVQVW